MGLLLGEVCPAHVFFVISSSSIRPKFEPVGIRRHPCNSWGSDTMQLPWKSQISWHMLQAFVGQGNEMKKCILLETTAVSIFIVSIKKWAISAFWLISLDLSLSVGTFSHAHPEFNLLEHQYENSCKSTWNLSLSNINLHLPVSIIHHIIYISDLNTQ